ncbi:MAG: MoaD/ThiS family protein [Acidobacteria bacterium]|nr:MoaD/ThiS family protein [Acidobacteriota bacterium]
MNIRIKFFAGVADVVGHSELVFSPAEKSLTIAGLWQRLCDGYPPLGAYSGRILSARNHRFARPDDVLVDGDEIAFFPPVSGG